MVAIRLLTSVHGTDSPVVGDPNDTLDVPAEVAAVWADGERAELVDITLDELAVLLELDEVYVVDLVKQHVSADPLGHPAAPVDPLTVTPLPTADAAAAATPKRRQRRTRPVST